jgi:hypothetical protein
LQQKVSDDLRRLWPVLVVDVGESGEAENVWIVHSGGT